MLLLSSITYGFAMIAMQRGHARGVQGWLLVTALFGAAFLGIELYEFSHLIADGATPQRSAFLSAFFTLVGTHGAHISVGLLWMAVMMLRIWRLGLNRANLRRLTMLSLFWHFLDVVWIFIFTTVYLMGIM